MCHGHCRNNFFPSLPATSFPGSSLFLEGGIEKTLGTMFALPDIQQGYDGAPRRVLEGPHVIPAIVK